MRKDAGPILICAALGIAFLCSLGVWQVKRLAWKNDLIAKLEARMNAPAMPLADVLAKRGSGEDIEYLKVKLAGRVDPSKALRKIASVGGDPGWEIIAPLSLDDGALVLVDMGTIAEGQAFPQGQISQNIEGVVRLHNTGRGAFDVVNDVAGNKWFWWDLTAMLAAAQPAQPQQTTPFIVQKLSNNSVSGLPITQAPKVELNNNHLGYAITWFGLAAALAGVAGAFVFGRERG